MPYKMVKPLGLAKDLNELNKLAELPKEIKLKKPMQLCISSKAILARAEECHKIGDEENAYIYYMKYFNLISVAQKSKDFEKIKDKTKSILGTNANINGRMDILVKLKDSLKKRYAALAEAAAVAKEKEIEQKTVSTTTVSPKTDDQLFINCAQFYQMLDSSMLVLLMDCRSEENFQLSKVRFPKIINIPKEIIKNGQSASLLSCELKSDAKKLFQLRGDMDLVVLIDEDTTQEPENMSKPIWILHNILTTWDIDTKYKQLRILNGGFQDFVLKYPMKTTNHHYDPRSTESSNLYPNLSDIEYPDTDAIKMKPKLDAIKSTYIPRIDRTVKPTYGKTIDAHQQPTNAVALAREKEIIFNQVLEKQKEVITIGDELSRVVSSTTPNEVDQTEWFNRQSELEYKFIQKENELNDTVSELHSVSQDIESKLSTIQIDQRPEVDEIEARLQAKERERLQYEQKRLQAKQEIDAKLKVTQERHKRFLESKEEEDELIRPKKPTIDRSSKPTHDRAEVMPQRYRDFSPVHGSYGEIGATGLKNLGNTCYMNSVIQCLFNVHVLCEFFLKNVYTKHLNRKSKTHGIITEELAELCKQVWSGQYKSVAARDFRSAIGQEYKIFASYDQQDAHEFMVILIDIMHLELQIPMEIPIENDKAQKSEVAWREFIKNMNSVVQNLFFGQIRSTLICRSCRFESATYDGFSHLSLELPQNNKQCHLYDCMRLYFDGEVIDGWKCPQCKQNREAIKKLDISRPPPVLVIHLKRFYASMTSSNTYEKKQNYVYFQTEGFQIADYITPSLKKKGTLSEYNLIAVANHYGTLNRGHYTASCKNHKSKQWYKYDDNYVTPIDSKDVNSSAGYILFYSRV